MKLGTLKINQIYQGDCLNLLKQLPDNCIDLIFADPPYNLRLRNELFLPNHTKVDAVNDELRTEYLNEYFYPQKTLS